MTAPCCEWHDVQSACGPEDVCCSECPARECVAVSLAGPVGRWTSANTALVLAAFVFGFGVIGR